MKAKINGFEFEGTPEKFRNLFGQKSLPKTSSSGRSGKSASVKTLPDNRRHKHWTEDEEKRLMTLIKQGVTDELAGAMLGRSTSAVINRKFEIFRVR